MKIFNKVLALVLALFTLVSVLPMSVFAADKWADVNTEVDGDNGAKVTLTLDAGTLAAILERDGISADLLQSLKSGISVDVAALREAFSVQDLFDIIPRDKWLEVFELNEIVEAIGLDTLAEYVDIPALLADVDSAKLADLIKSIPGLESYVYAKDLLKDGYITTNLIVKHVYESKLLNDVDVAKLKKAVLTDANLTVAELKSLVDTDKIVKDGKIDVDAVLDKDATAAEIKKLGDGFEQYITDKNALKSKIQNKYSDLATLANINNLEAVVNALNNWKAYVKADGSFDYKLLFDNDKLTVKELITWNVVNVEALYNNGIVVINDGSIPGGTLDIPAYIQEHVDTVVNIAATKAKFVTAGANVEDYISDMGKLKTKVLDKYTELKTLSQVENLNTIKGIVETWKVYLNDDASVNFKKLFADNKINASEMLTWNVLDTDALLDKGIVVVDENKVVTAMNGLDAATLKGYVKSMAKALDMLIGKLGLDYCVEMIGGYDKVTDYINVPALVAEIDVAGLINKINANPDAKTLNDYIDLDGILGAVSVSQVLEIIPINTILGQLDNDEIVELVKLLNVKQYVRPVLALVVDRVLENVNGITLNGQKIASEKSDTKLLQLHPDALISALGSMIPTLSDFINMEEGKIFSANVVLDYTVDASVDANKTAKSKSLTFELVLAGDVSRLQNAASKLQALLDRYINELKISKDEIVVDLNAPELFTILYGEILDLDALTPELREKVMNIVNLDGNDMIGFIGEDLTFAELLEILDSVEPTALYEKLKAVTLVKTCLEKLDSVTGKDISAKDLNELVQYVASNGSTLESVCEALENKTGRDVLALLESLSVKTDNFVDKAEEIAAIEKLLSAVESKLGIDVSDISVEEILNRGKDVPILEKVSDVVASKIGVDVREALLNNTVDELYEKALAKLAEREDAYNKVRNYLTAKLELLPESVMNVSINDLYRGEGEFGKSGSITYNPKALVQKVVDKVLARLNIDAADKAAELVMGCIADADWTTTIDLSLNFADLRRITFMTRDGEVELLNAYLPVGTDLKVFENNKNLTAGYEFSGWATEDKQQITVMPDHDVVVYADLHMVEVSFQSPEGDDLGKIMLPMNGNLSMYADKLAEIEDLIAEADEVTKLYKGKTVSWFNGEDKVDLANTAFVEDTTLVYDLTPNWFLTFATDTPIDYDVTYDQGKYKITIYGDLPAGFVLNMDRENLIADAMADSRVELLVAIKPTSGAEFTFLSFNNTVLNFLGGKSNETVEFIYATPDSVADTAFGELYGNATGVFAYDFSFSVDGDLEKAAKFESGVAITMPFAPTATQVSVYTMGENGKENVDFVAENGYITLKPAHFSEFLIANEFVLSFEFVQGTTELDQYNFTKYYPAGTVVTLDFAKPDGYDILEIVDDGGIKYDHNGTYTMPDANAVLTVKLTSKTYYIYYYVNGTLQSSQPFKAKDIGDNTFVYNYPTVIGAFTAPAGYANTGAWVGDSTLDTRDIYLYWKWNIIEYTIEFYKNVGDAAPYATITGLTVENRDYALPAVPNVAGKKGTWDIPTTLTPDSNNVVKIYAKYEALTYPIITDQNASVSANSAVAGTEITVTVTNNKPGYTATVVVKDANGETVTVNNGKFTMVANTVYVNVTYAPKTLNYTINGIAGTAEYGTTVSVPEIVVRPGEYLASVSDNCKLVSYSRDNDGTLRFNYAFVLTEDNTAITYEVKSTPLASLQILNGKLFGGSGDPTSDQPNVKFNGWSEKVANVLSFATFTLVREPASLLWLWILLGILLFIALIVLIYVLHITGKIGVNFLTRFAVWLVGLFFALCLAVAALGLKIAHLFGKSDDPEDYGFTEVKHEEEATEEVAEEVTEEVSEENTEEMSEEENVDVADVVVAEAVAEEAVAEEAPAEEATEEVAAEEAVAEEAPVEEATEEVVAEEVAEEAPAEEATEEVAAEEAAEEAPVEEATEEVVAEEAVAEEAPAEEATEEATEEVAAEEAVAEDAPVEEATEEVAAEEAVAEEVPAEEATEEVVAEEAVAEEAPVEEATEEVAAEEAVAEEAPVEEATEEVVAEEAVAEEAPAEEATEEVAAEEAVAEEAPVEEATEEAAAEEAVAEDAPVEEATEEVAAEEAVAEEAPAEEATEEVAAEEAVAEEAPVEEATEEAAEEEAVAEEATAEAAPEEVVEESAETEETDDETKNNK